MSHRYRVLVIDDELEARELLQVVLTAEGFDVITADDALSGLRTAYKKHPDAILLDVMMPNVDGFEACRRLRELTDVPIIYITARGAIEDVVQGFCTGADDYVIKPFNSTELISRLRACLRRAGERTESGSQVLFPAESVMLDCDRRELVIDGRVIHLTPKEFEILRLLTRHPGKVFSTDAILARVWGAEEIGALHLVKQYVYRLRKKIEKDPATPEFIHTIRGGGYYFSGTDIQP